MAISVAQLTDRQRHQCAITQHHIAIDQNIGNLAAIGTAVHADEPADRAGDRAKEFKTGDPGIAGGGGNQNARGTAAAIERHLIPRSAFGKSLAETDYHARNPAIADYHVGT